MVGKLQEWKKENIRSVIKYVSPTMVVKATVRGKWGARDKHVECVVSMGKPNFKEREYVKDCKKSGEPFPVKGVQLEFQPEPRKMKSEKASRKKRA